MDVGYASALSGLAGALIGSLANVVTTWATHSSQLRDKNQGADYARKQKLFSEFVAEASRLYADALSHQKDDATDLVGLYALVAKMRLVAPGPVVTAAEDAMKAVVEAYLEPNRTLREIRTLAQEGGLDFLLKFGEECRSHLAGQV
jgi:hypothetical protein